MYAAPVTIPEIARLAWLDERTVRRFLHGAPVRPSSLRRIQRAYRRLGLPPPAQLAAPPPPGTGKR